MAVTYKQTENGGFVCGDTDTRRTSYAYPTSPYATLARKMPDRIAADMMAATNRFTVTGRGVVAGTDALTEYDARNWAVLEA